MDERIETLADLVLRPGHALEERVRNRLDESEGMSELRTRLVGAALAGAAVKPSDIVANNLRDLLDVSLAEDVLVRVWNEAKLFRRYLDRERYPAHETIDVTLVEHTVEVDYEPALEVRLGEVPLPTIRIRVSASLTLEGAVVSIRDGKVLNVASGTLGGRADVKWRDLTLLTEKIGPVRIPGAKELSRPITIAA